MGEVGARHIPSGKRNNICSYLLTYKLRVLSTSGTSRTDHPNKVYHTLDLAITSHTCNDESCLFI